MDTPTLIQQAERNFQTLARWIIETGEYLLREKTITLSVGEFALRPAERLVNLTCMLAVNASVVPEFFQGGVSSGALISPLYLRNLDGKPVDITDVNDLRLYLSTATAETNRIHNTKQQMVEDLRATVAIMRDTTESEAKRRAAASQINQFNAERQTRYLPLLQANLDDWQFTPFGSPPKNR